MVMWLMLVVSLALVYMDPFLALHLETLGMSEDNVGWAFAVSALAFALGSPVWGAACQKFDRRLVLFFCAFM